MYFSVSDLASYSVRLWAKYLSALMGSGSLERLNVAIERKSKRRGGG
jgi:hypothetical protein